MTLKKVYMNSDVYTVCLEHVLSTEKEEVMGLLIGKINDSTCVSYISACKILARSDKQPDRVEISPEQLTDAAMYAEQLSELQGEPLRVIGWYHSHPHITVWPSHVDLRTQSMYQNMDKLFVGLIFSVFATNRAHHNNEIQLTCFQTLVQGTQYLRAEIPLEIVPTHLSLACLQCSVTLPQILNNEEQDNIGNTDEQSCDDLTRLHNNALQTLAAVHIAEKVSRPLLDVLEHVLLTNKTRLDALRRKKKTLERQLKS